jgi:hypothetical protein
LENILLFGHISSTSALIPFLIGIFSLKDHSSESKLILSLILFSILSDIIALTILKFGITTWPIFNLYYLIQFVLLSKVYILVLYPKGINMVLISFIVISILNMVFIQGPFLFNTYTTYIGGLILITYALLYLHKLMREIPVEKIENLPMLWITFAVLTYFGGTSILFLFNNYMIANQPENHQIIWLLHNVLNILKNILFAIALWKDLKLKIY